MTGTVKPIPEGSHTITMYLVVKDAARAIDFYQKAFGAREICRMEGPGGNGVMHAEIKIGDSTLMLGDEWPTGTAKSPETLGGTTCSIHLYVDNVDLAFTRATKAGCKPEMPPADMFWGDRYGKLTDPFGHSWGLATHKEDVAPEEMQRRAKEFVAKMASGA